MAVYSPPTKTAAQILNMSRRDLRRFVARLQEKVAYDARAWAGGGHPDDWPECDENLAEAGRIKSEVYRQTRESKEDS